MERAILGLVLLFSVVFGDSPIISKKIFSNSEVDFKVNQFQEVNSNNEVVREIVKFGRFEYSISGIEHSTAYGKKTVVSYSLPLELSDGSNGNLEITVSTFGTVQLDDENILHIPSNPTEITYKLDWPEMLDVNNKFQMSSDVGYAPALADTFKSLDASFKQIWSAKGTVVGYRVDEPLNIVFRLPEQVHESEWSQLQFESKSVSSFLSSKRFSGAISTKAKRDGPCYCWDNDLNPCNPDNNGCPTCSSCHNPNTGKPCGETGDCECCYSSATSIVSSIFLLVAALALLL